MLYLSPMRSLIQPRVDLMSPGKHLFPPNVPPINTYYSNTFRCEEGDSGMNPTSNHPGSVNVSFMDGSVWFIKHSVNLQTWWFMGTRGRGEIVSADSY
jgi:prepilin-type processing-associated H-X9-DG protein